MSDKLLEEKANECLKKLIADVRVASTSTSEVTDESLRDSLESTLNLFLHQLGLQE